MNDKRSYKNAAFLLVELIILLFLIIKESLFRIVNKLGLAWWARIETINPDVTYWFGPFILRRNLSLEVKDFLAEISQEHPELITHKFLRNSKEEPLTKEIVKCKEQAEIDLTYLEEDMNENNSYPKTKFKSQSSLEFENSSLLSKNLLILILNSLTVIFIIYVLGGVNKNLEKDNTYPEKEKIEEVFYLNKNQINYKR